MFSLTRPNPEAIARWRAGQSQRDFPYGPVGGTAKLDVPGSDPSLVAALDGYIIDRDWARIGNSRADYERAVAALRRWEMFRLGWVELVSPDAPIEVGATVGVLMRALGIWSLNACRIVYRVEDCREGPSGLVERFGFAYGTLPDHALRGEERFSVEWCPATATVGYGILRFSRPRVAPPRLARVYGRRLQRRFARDSLRAMVAAAQV